MNFLPTQADAEARYGKIENGVWANESQWLELLALPSWFTNLVINSATGKPTEHIYCNKDLSGPLLQALANVHTAGVAAELKTFDGCFNIRSVRGEPNHLSTHSYGLAVDFNAAEFPLGSTYKWSDIFIQGFYREGFTWGGTFQRKDAMHWQLCGAWK